MNLKTKLTFIIYLWFNLSFACDCPPHERETMVVKGLKNSQIVFYGELIKIDTINHTYSFRIIELFKGEHKSLLINGKYTQGGCEIFPFEKDFYIVYSNFNEDNTISLNYCLPTQTKKIPPGFLPPIPLITTSERRTTKLDSLNYEVDNLKIRNETLYDWFYQLEQLRFYKLSQTKITESNKNTDLQLILIICLVINVFLLLFLIYILTKKRFSSNNQIID